MNYLESDSLSSWRASTDSCLVPSRFTKELADDVDRATLLIVYVFCLRLQNEDFTFIQRFILRHLELKCAYKGLYQQQDISPSQTSSVSTFLPNHFNDPLDLTYGPLSTSWPANDTCPSYRQCIRESRYRFICPISCYGKTIISLMEQIQKLPIVNFLDTFDRIKGCKISGFNMVFTRHRPRYSSALHPRKRCPPMEKHWTLSRTRKPYGQF